MLSSFLVAISVVLPIMNKDPGEVYDFSLVRNVHVLEFYFNDCPACNSNAANVHSLAMDLDNHPVAQVLDVGIDRANSEYEDWIRKHSPTHPVLKDRDRHLAGLYSVRLYPTTIVLGCDNKVIYRNTGVWSSKATEEINAAVTQGVAGCESL